jgi:hypothetical protein
MTLFTVHNLVLQAEGWSTDREIPQNVENVTGDCGCGGYMAMKNSFQ